MTAIRRWTTTYTSAPLRDFKPVNSAQGSAVIKGSWYGCYVTTADDSSKPVAMGRIIGDGGWYFHIADMAVLLSHQRRGLGDAVLKRLLAKIKTNTAPGEPYVSLMADAPGRRLYEKNGFADTMPQEMGISLIMNASGSEGGA
ncbi:hypothetical protein DL766_001142 [Monosporascus sp. MC13-8B]|uniref:N-acetyltransferase domain-containing protein n=1 Tax=Monosporascus cannonballus TaxID=155416 RepID=A0ABY0HH60_9PEZI|nr:hypothetical protein DL762_002724 [Monosporascus cannonballus]RYO97644.1 hypothetical protein DL763_002621 [Monosporascus cannonballus]RYP38063.1 hypothetical protein DL766_001142 [Monosporascus sp. MC13-8B]